MLSNKFHMHKKNFDKANLKFLNLSTILSLIRNNKHTCPRNINLFIHFFFFLIFISTSICYYSNMTIEYRVTIK